VLLSSPPSPPQSSRPARSSPCLRVLAFHAQSQQLDLQQQLKDQREANAKQAEILELQAAGLREARERRDAQEAMVHAWQTAEDTLEPTEIFAHVKNISEQPLCDVTVQ
jgi:hypothetical protein